MPTIILEEDLQELFYDLHAAGFVSDGKEISDAELTVPPAELLAIYREQKDTPGFDLQAFYQQHFHPAPELASGYVSNTSLPVETHIERLWEVLTRQPQEAAERYSTRVSLPHAYVVPGGRFNEIYYWDSYFTMLGLRESGRIDLIESMLQNFAHLIDTFGFIPNGNRTYFRGRSQPPFFALMVDLLAEERGEKIYQTYLPALEKEYAFWMDGRKEVKDAPLKRVVPLGAGLVLNRYYDNIPDPRTEMYSDDIELLEKHGAGGKQLLLDIRAACESGWDFSSRWCRKPDKLETLHTTDILPVDLNSLLYHLEMTLAKANGLAGKTNREEAFLLAAVRRANLIRSRCWDPGTKFYHDYNFVKKARTPAFTLASVFPLYFNLATPGEAAPVAARLEADFLAPGGLTTTNFRSGQQWDAPNGWAPLQWMAIKGLRNYGFNDLANTVKERWVALNRKVYQNTGKLLEKYNVVDTGLETGGGEYPVQDGFGWTNGVLLRLIREDD